MSGFCVVTFAKLILRQSQSFWIFNITRNHPIIYMCVCVFDIVCMYVCMYVHVFFFPLHFPLAVTKLITKLLSCRHIPCFAIGSDLYSHFIPLSDCCFLNPGIVSVARGVVATYCLLLAACVGSFAFFK